MTIKEELEILRGEPIQVFTGDPMDIPCIETSDPERLCQHPVVSVHMITYNHEPYIRQAIEGVMMQQTDFEFELVIGEDCSTDKTREICFEYQKRHPDKIRVLWCDRNLYRNPHPAGGNGQRTTAHCRGEFIAFCEGDDYWIDPLKLQKQVDVMRKHPNVGLCFCGAINHDQTTGKEWSWDAQHEIPCGLILGNDFCSWHIFGRDPRCPGPETFLMTASTMVRKSVCLEAKQRFEVFDWQLRLGDTTLWLGTAALSDCFYISDEVSTYRRTTTGACASSNGGVWMDAYIVRLYFAAKLELSYLDKWMWSKSLDPFRHLMIGRWIVLPKEQSCTQYKTVLRNERFPVFSSLRMFPARAVFALMGFTMKSKVMFGRIYIYLHI